MQHLLLAGFFAACGSAFGKLSGGDYEFLYSYLSLQAIVEPYIILVQAICVALMILCNILNWRHFLRALHSTEQTLTATVVSSAANYIFAFIFGIILFNESVSLLTSFGTALIVIGMCFLYI